MSEDIVTRLQAFLDGASERCTFADVRNAVATIAALRAEVERLERDAGRWRAIRECRKTVKLYVYEDESDPCSGDWSYKNDPEDFDRFADAAIAQTKERA